MTEQHAKQLSQPRVRSGRKTDLSPSCAEPRRQLYRRLLRPLHNRPPKPTRPSARSARSGRHSCPRVRAGNQKSKASVFIGFPVISETSGAGIGVPGSRKRLVIGYRRSRPKFFSVTFTPGAAWRRLYSAMLIMRSTRITVSRSKPAATIAEIGSSRSTSRSRIGSSTA